MTYGGRDILLGGFFMALALVIPILFHATGLGSAFFPMFYPVITAGFLLPFRVSVAVGLIAPLVSALLTGMPPLFPPIAFIMAVEGLILTGLPALLFRRLKWPVVLTTVVTMAADRLLALGLVWIVSSWLDLPGKVIGLADLAKGLPGVALILVIVPFLVKGLDRKLRCMPVME